MGVPGGQLGSVTSPKGWSQLWRLPHEGGKDFWGPYRGARALGGGGGLEQDRRSWGCQPGEERLGSWVHPRGCSGLRIGVPCALMAKLGRQGSREGGSPGTGFLPRRGVTSPSGDRGRQMMSGV